MSNREQEYVDEAWLDKYGNGSVGIASSTSVKRRWGEVYLTRKKIQQKLQKKVAKFLLEHSLLFLDEGGVELDIITEPLRNQSEAPVLHEMCSSLGYRILGIKNDTRQGKYLYSDGGGHYSVDTHQTIHFCRITIVH